jgi:hypothetical protein
MTTTTRPHFTTSGPDLISLILANDESAIEEGRQYRHSPKVRAALASIGVTSELTVVAPVAKKAPAKKAAARKTAARKATTTTVPGTDAWKAEAKKAFDAAFAAAPEGQKLRAGRAAYGAIKYASK